MGMSPTARLLPGSSQSPGRTSARRWPPCICSRQGPENRIEPVGAAEAARAVLESVLFFAHDPKLVGKVFDSVCELVQRVPVQRLTFLPDSRVWELIV